MLHASWTAQRRRRHPVANLAISYGGICPNRRPWNAGRGVLRSEHGGARNAREARVLARSIGVVVTGSTNCYGGIHDVTRSAGHGSSHANKRAAISTVSRASSSVGWMPR